MADTLVKCTSCARVNPPNARYCIDCGSILARVFCSSCGTANPEGLEKCLDCGAPLPSLSGMRWKPIVTILQPTSAMGYEGETNLDFLVEAPAAVQEPPKDVLSRLREKLRL